MSDTLSRRAAHAAALFLFVFAAGCGNKDAQQVPPPPEVGVQVVEERAAPIDLTYMARVAGVREVEVRARVSGILLQKRYKEGERVKEGDLLFRIDPSQYAAEAARARAQRGVEQARLLEAQRDRDRVIPLSEQGVVSRRERDQAIANYESAEAAVAAATAALKRTELDLSYTEVRAPISGLTSREARSEGSLVNAGDDTALLTRIVQTDSLYVEFSMPAVEAGLVRSALAQGPLRVVVLATNGSELPDAAELTFLDTAVDQSSGTVRARATLKNPNANLLPGQFVRVRIAGITLPKTAVIPARAVLRSPMGTMVWIVGAGDKVEPRPVQLGDTAGNDVAVLSGLKAGERVIINGVIKVQPGAVVKPVMVDAKQEVGEPQQQQAPAGAPPQNGEQQKTAGHAPDAAG